MNNKIINEAKTNLKARKLEQEKLIENNLALALSNEEFEKLYKEEKKLIFELSKSSNPNLSLLENNKKKQEEFLKSIGFTFEDITIRPFCNKCNDTLIHNNKTCSCLKKEISKYLLKQTELDRPLSTFKDSNFKLFDQENRERIKTLYEKMKKWCNQQSEIKNIIISGPTGIGKTYLLEAMLDELIKKEKFALYTTAFKLNQTFLKYHTTYSSEEKLAILEKYLECDVLFIDDLGTETLLNNVTCDYLYLIINERINSGKSIVISTNLTTDEILDRYGERIFSRLVNKRIGLFIRYSNSDLRLRK